MQRVVFTLWMLAGCASPPAPDALVLHAGRQVSYAVGGLVEAGATLAAAQVTAVGTDLDVILAGQTLWLTPTTTEPGTAVVEWEAVDHAGRPVRTGTLHLRVDAP